MVRALLLFSFIAACAGEAVFEDSPALTSIWEAASSGSTDNLVNILIQNRDYAQQRSSDGRGPMFWAYEFKNVDALALFLHLKVPSDSEDIDGHPPQKFFDGDEATIEEFEADAKAKVDELAAVFKTREEEFYAYQ